MNRVSRSSRRVSSSVSLVTALAAFAVLMSGCISVPTSGGVEAGGDVDTNVEVDFDFLPSGPTAGASQQEILQGFFAATTASQNNYRIARSYLAEEVADLWNPYAGTLVRSREGLIEQVDDTTLSYTVPITASVDAVGRYSTSESSLAQTLPAFRFVEEDGEWRISELGNGILISQQAFPSAFSQQTLFYWDAGFRNLVPDLRWFPTRSEVATRIVRAVLEPPTSWLAQGATVSAVPEGTALVLAPVTVSAGIAQVDLTSEVLALSDRERQRLRLQLAASLSGVSGVSGVQITVDQNTIAIPEWTSGSPDVIPQVDPRLLARTESGFGFISSIGDVETLGTLSAKVIDVEATQVALAPTTTLAAALTPEGVVVVRTGDAPTVLLDARSGLIAPSIDGYQFTWSIPASGGDLHATELDGTVHDVELTLPNGVRVVSLNVSRDDARVLIMLDGEGGPRLLVSAVTRDETSGVPIRLGELRELPVTGDAAVDATWVDEVRVASITRTDGQTLVEVHEIGGRSRPLGLPPEAVQLVGGNGGTEGIRVLSADGAVFEPRGSGWQNTGLRASFLGSQQ